MRITNIEKSGAVFVLGRMGRPSGQIHFMAAISGLHGSRVFNVE